MVTKHRLVSLPKLIPNFLTMMALIAGMTSVQMSINGKFETAVFMLIIAAILDVLDGAVARLLKAQSAFGAELDSLSDFLAFGVAPSVLLYQWALNDAGKLGWIACIVVPVAAALRLARFNVAAKNADDTSDSIPLWQKRYFTGVPTPAGAGLVMLPVYIWFLFPETFTVFSFATPLIGVWAIFVAMLMVSRLPTFSLKYLAIPVSMQVPVMALCALILAALIHAPWVSLTLIALLYTISIPYVFHLYRKQEKQFQKPEDLTSLAFGYKSDETNNVIQNDKIDPI
jgi:CDP-diacylglycerol---serine O-phosphatidyltransferase